MLAVPTKTCTGENLNGVSPGDVLCYTGRRMLKGSGERFWHFSHQFSGYSHALLHQASFRVVALYASNQVMMASGTLHRCFRSSQV